MSQEEKSLRFAPDAGGSCGEEEGEEDVEEDVGEDVEGEVGVVDGLVLEEDVDNVEDVDDEHGRVDGVVLDEDAEDVDHEAGIAKGLVLVLVLVASDLSLSP